jgi:hypothetical protein
MGEFKIVGDRKGLPEAYQRASRSLPEGYEKFSDYILLYEMKTFVMDGI